MRIENSHKDRIAKEYRAYIDYEIGVRRHVILLRIGVALAILLGLLNLALHLLARVG